MAITVASVVKPRSARAQSPAKVSRIGTLSEFNAPPPGTPSLLDEPLRELGYVEGQNLVFDRRFANGDTALLPGLASELVSRKVDVLVSISFDVATEALRRATSTIPIVMVLGVDPVGRGLVKSFARPGGNVTGITVDVTPEIWAKRIEFLKEAAPRISHVFVLTNLVQQFKEYRNAAVVAANQKGVQLEFISVRRSNAIDASLTSITKTKRGLSGLVVPGDASTRPHIRRIVTFADEQRLPAIYGAREWIDSGGLMSYGPDIKDLFRRAAWYIDRILKGTRPGDLPVERPTKLQLVLNMKTAKALGLSLPSSLLLRADQIIE